MEKKKKLIIAFSTLGVLAVGVIVAIVAVIAAFAAGGSSGVNVTYTAKNVSATIIGKYHVCRGTCTGYGCALNESNYALLQTTDNEDSMVFTGEESGATTTKSFKPLGDLGDGIEGVYYWYEITNNSSTDTVNLEILPDFTEKENARVNMHLYEDGYGWVTNINTLAFGSKYNTSIAPNTTLKFIVFVYGQGSASVKVDGSFKMTLTKA